MSQFPFCVVIVPESLDFTLNLILLLNYPLMVQKGETKFAIVTNCSKKKSCFPALRACNFSSATLRNVKLVLPFPSNPCYIRLPVSNICNILSMVCLTSSPSSSEFSTSPTSSSPTSSATSSPTLPQFSSPSSSSLPSISSPTNTCENIFQERLIVYLPCVQFKRWLGASKRLS